MRGMEGTWLSGGHEDADREWDATEMRDKARTSSRSRPYSLSFVRPAKTLNPAPRTVWAARQTMRGMGETWLSGCEGPTDREWDATVKADDAKSTSQSRPSYEELLVVYKRRLLTPLLPSCLSPPSSRTISIVGQYCCPRVLLGARTQRQGDWAGGC